MEFATEVKSPGSENANDRDHQYPAQDEEYGQLPDQRTEATEASPARAGFRRRQCRRSRTNIA
jgi:hypothetical protein